MDDGITPPAPTGEPAQPAPGWFRNPEAPGQRYWDGTKWTENYADDQGQVLPVPPPPAAVTGEQKGDGLVPVGYILGVLFPIIGFVIGIVLLARRNNHGAGVMVVSVVAFVVWASILAAS